MTQQHPHPEELLARLTREMDTNLRQLNTNPLHNRSRPRVRDEVRNFLVCFAVGLVLTVGLLVLAAWRG